MAYKTPMWAIAVLLMLKAGFMAFYLTPPADIPDESGHYAYVNDIANGEFFPVLGKASIPNDLWRANTLENTYRENYIAQHPPLYYAVAAIPLAIGKAFTADKALLSRLPRLVSAVSLGLLVMVLFYTQIAAGLSAKWSLVTSPAIAFIPMVSHLSSGITNDIFLFLMAALATLYFVRYLQGHRDVHAYTCAFWLTMAGATKMTAWILVGAMVVILLFEMRGPLKSWIVRGAGISALAFSGPVWWMARSYYYLGDPMAISVVPDKIIFPNFTLVDLLTTQPLVDWLFQHFYALIGFSGYCQNAELLHLCVGAHITRVEGFPVLFFAIVTGAGALIMATFAWGILLRKAQPTSPTHRSIQEWLASVGDHPRLIALLRPVLATLGLIAFALTAHFLQRTPDWAGLLFLLALATLFAMPFWSAFSLAHASEQGERLVFYGTAILAVTTMLIFNQAHKAYLITAMLKGIQGRYLYPFLPLFIAGGAYALQRWRVLRVLALPVVLLLLFNELSAFIEQIVPFYLLVRI